MSSTTVFDLPKLEALCDALVADTGSLGHRDVSNILRNCGMPVPASGPSRKARLMDAFSHNQYTLRSPARILQFVQMACDPARFIGNQERHEEYRAQVNSALSMIGKAVGPDGKTIDVKLARTVFEAQQRAAELRETMAGRGSHPDVVRFCSAELMQDNYFHAVLEAVKSVAQKIRDKTGLDGDGAELVGRAFGTNDPLWVINAYRNEGHKKEQAGFCNLLIGIFGMFRNPLAHEPKIYWEMKREDAEDLLSMLSLIHRRIDSAYMKPRV